jgi:broad specificity phosphatase PhoE
MRWLGAALTAVMLVISPVHALPAAHATTEHNIVVTFVRHGQSTANAAHVIDTTVPGPDITPLGYVQAVTAANELSINRYDGIWASTMVRTQQTAAPMSQALDEPVTVLPGLQEIDAGTNDGLSEDTAPKNDAPGVWLQPGKRNVRVPGAINGFEFQSRFSDAVKTIYDSGETNPIVYSHGWAITYWVLMTAKNSDPSLANPSLANGGHVMIAGNPKDGWTLVNWDGRPVAAAASR